MNEASKFVSARKCSITESRINNIVWYISECYIQLINDNVRYSKKESKNKTTLAFEDFLKFRLIEDYLIKYKFFLREKSSCLECITFAAETQKEYIDIEDEKQKPAKIDVYVNRLGLDNVWNECEENIYFAIECKRIKHLCDTSLYIKDIKKFTNRSYLSLRLPFEGQLAFIESKSITHVDISKEINDKLMKENSIITDTPLQPYILNQNVSFIYRSKHKRNIKNRPQFSIYHLLLDYSDVVID